MDTARSPGLATSPGLAGSPAPTPRVHIGSDGAAKALGVWIAGLLAAHIAGAVIRETTGAEALGGIIPAFDMSAERSVPTWSTAAILAVTSAVTLALAALLRNAGERTWRNWSFVGLVVLVLSVEEVADLHGYWSDRLHEEFDSSGALRYAWVVPAALLAIAVAATQLRFVLRLERRLRNTVLWAGALYVGAAIGVEVLQGALEPDGVAGALVAGLEETTEVAAIAIVCVALLRHIEANFGRPTISVS